VYIWLTFSSDPNLMESDRTEYSTPHIAACAMLAHCLLVVSVWIAL
jgi:hypothetical protein